MKLRNYEVMLAGLLLTGCSSNPLLQTGRATSTEAIEAIQQSLEPGQSAQKTTAGVPPQVAQALLPPLQTGFQDTSERFDVSAEDLPAAAFFAGLVRGTGFNVLVSPKVDTQITLHLSNVTLPEVMDMLGDQYGLDIVRTGKLYKVMPNGLQTRIFQIDYLNFKRSGGSETQVSSGQVSSGSGSGGRSSRSGGSSGGASGSSAGSEDRIIGTRITTSTDSDFWVSLQQAVQMIVGTEAGHQVISTPDAGVLLVKASGEQLRAVEDYLRRTQLIMDRQVIIEAKILEVALNESFQQGVDWTYLEKITDKVSADGSAKRFFQGDLNSQLLTSPKVGGVFSASLQVSDFNGLIELLGLQGNVQVLSSPRISTVNNQKAVIKVGTDEFFVTDIDFDQNNGSSSSTNNTTTSVELTPFFSGISLDVTPQISEAGDIILHVHPAVSNVVDQQKIITIADRDVTLPLAQSTVRETDSIVKAQSGQIVVIGGLIQHSSEDNNASVPWLSDIPWIGEVFKQKRFSSKKSELVILLRPVVTDAAAQRADISASAARMQTLQQLLQAPESPAPQAARQ